MEVYRQAADSRSSNSYMSFKSNLEANDITCQQETSQQASPKPSIPVIANMPQKVPDMQTDGSKPSSSPLQINKVDQAPSSHRVRKLAIIRESEEFKASDVIKNIV